MAEKQEQNVNNNDSSSDTIIIDGDNGADDVPIVPASVANFEADNLYITIYPGKHLTVAVVGVGMGEDGYVAAEILDCMYQSSAYSDRGIPDISRARQFGGSVLKRVRQCVETSRMDPTAILVRNPPPAAAIGSKNPEFLQHNTWLEGYVVGMLYSAYPNISTWYVHPKAIRDTFFPQSDVSLWGSREMEELAAIDLATWMVGEHVDHEKTAACVIMAAHYYKKFSASAALCSDHNNTVGSGGDGGAISSVGVAVATTANSDPAKDQKQPLPILPIEHPAPSREDVERSAPKGAWANGVSKIMPRVDEVGTVYQGPPTPVQHIRMVRDHPDEKPHAVCTTCAPRTSRASRSAKRSKAMEQ